MSRPARTRIRHGMASCTRYGCTRPECRNAYNRNRRQLAADAARGLTATVPARQAADWARHLALNGMPAQDIADRSGIHCKTINKLLTGRCDTIYRDTADAVLGVPTPAPGYQTDSDGLVDAVGDRRRLRALTALGYTLPVLADAVGVTPETVGAIRQHRRRYVRISVHLAIVDAYERLQHEDPLKHGVTRTGSTRARRWARRQQWADPLWWEDYGGIDDPDAPERDDTPADAEPKFTRADAQHVAAEIRHLAGFGVPPHEIAARVERSETYVRDQIRGVRGPGWRNKLEEAA